MIRSGKVVEMRGTTALCTAVVAVLVCMVAGTMNSGCLDPSSREGSGVCYPEEHQDDHENCACEGPCEEGFWCVNGTCTPICDSGSCSPFCGNGECEPQYGEDCYSCPGDCGCDSSLKYSPAPGAIVINDYSDLALYSKGDNGTLVFTFNDPETLTHIGTGTVLLAELRHGGVYAKIKAYEVSDGKLVVHDWEVPTLAEAFSEAHLEYELPVEFGTLEFSGPLADRIRTYSSDKADDIDEEYSPPNQPIQLEGVVLVETVLSDDQGGSASISLTIAEGQLKIEPTVIYKLEKGAFDIPTSATIAINYDVSLSMLVVGTVDGSVYPPPWEGPNLLGAANPLTNVPLGIIIFGVEVRPTLEAYIDGGMSIEVQTDFNLSGEFGVEWKGLNVTKIANAAPEASVGAPDIEGYIEVGVSPGLKVIAYVKVPKLAEFNLFVQGFLKFVGGMYTPPLRLVWDTFFGVEVGGELEIDIPYVYENSWPFSFFTWESDSLAGGEYLLEYCGDGEVNGGESCDEDELNDQTCEEKGYSGGTLKCTDDCKFDTSACCDPKDTKECKSGKLYWYDSCGGKGDVYDDCDDDNECTTDSCSEAACKNPEKLDGTSCTGGECKNGKCKGCEKEDHKKCVGTKLYWFDSCENQGNEFSCDDNNACTVDYCANDDCQKTEVADGEKCPGGKVCVSGECIDEPECIHDEDCLPACGEWGECTNFASVCDESGTWTRTCTEQVCADGACVAGIEQYDEPGDCQQDTDGTACGSKQCGEWGECAGFIDECDEVGEQSRSCTGSSCVSGTCKPDTEFEDKQPCSQITDTAPCGPVTTCDPWGECLDDNPGSCNEGGTRHRTCYDHSCLNSACDKGPGYQDDEPCEYDKEGNECQPPDCGSYGDCVLSGDPDCSMTGTKFRTCTPYKCENEVCESKTPYQDSAPCSGPDTLGDDCGPSGSGMKCKNQQCIDPECTVSSDCDQESCEYITSCEQNSPGTCSTSGHKTKECTSYQCVSFVCQANTTQTEEVCTYDTQGKPCGDAQCTPWSDCVYDTSCSETGAKTQECTGSACSGGNCQPSTPVTNTDTESCNRDTDDDACGGGMKCQNGTCQQDCDVACDGKECGPSGCGYDCPNTCDSGTEVCDGNKCVEDCDTICNWRECDWYQGCKCGECSGCDECNDYKCEQDCSCECAGIECGGPAGCSACNSCPDGYSCSGVSCEEDCSSKSYKILIVYPHKSIPDKSTSSGMLSQLKQACNDPFVYNLGASGFEEIDIWIGAHGPFDTIIVLGAQLAWDGEFYVANVWEQLFDNISSISSTWFQKSTYSGTVAYGCAGWDAEDTQDVADCLVAELVQRMEEGDSITNLSAGLCPP